MVIVLATSSQGLLVATVTVIWASLFPKPWLHWHSLFILPKPFGLGLQGMHISLVLGMGMPISPYHRHIGRRLGTRLLYLQARYRKAVQWTTILSKWKGTFRSNQPKVVPNISVGRNLNGKRPFLWAQDLSKRHGWLVKKAPVQLGIHWVRSLRWEPRTRLSALLRRRH